ncbi:MAG TPA: trypsin-like peptidase domain-containing protein [Solirubrobacteraceae bacterium]|nr:trypsin-like peptidase domain-containing protein [Solirubrobacteraceae bacterium]
MRGGIIWSHLLASVLGGLVLAGVLLALGVIGKPPRTQTVPVNLSAPPASDTADGAGVNLAQIYDQEAPGVVLVRATADRRMTSPFIRGHIVPGNQVDASGILISREGFILTTLHSIAAADPGRGISVVFNASLTRRALVMDEDAPDDIVLLKVDMTGVPPEFQPLPLGNSREVTVGESAFTLANPFGLDRTLASGVISALQRRLVAAGGSAVDDVIQTDLSASPGSDGSPLLDSSGNVVGINSQIEVSDGARGTYPVSFAVPIDVARALIPKGVLP